MGFFIGIYKGVATRQATGIGMFDDSHRGRCETGDRGQGNVEVEEIVE